MNDEIKPCANCNRVALIDTPIKEPDWHCGCGFRNIHKIAAMPTPNTIPVPRELVNECEDLLLLFAEVVQPKTRSRKRVVRAIGKLEALLK